MTVKSYCENLSSEKAAEVLAENSFDNIEVRIVGMGHKSIGAGHHQIWANFESSKGHVTLERVTTDMQLTDAWDDEEETYEGAHFESQEEVMAYALDYVLSLDSNKETLRTFLAK